MRNEPIVLKKGMSAEDVILLLGEPTAKRPMEPLDLNLEVWTYQRKMISSLKMVQTGEKEVPYVNPISGESTVIYEPILNPETTEIHETTELMFGDGHLVAWKRYQESDIEYMNQ